MKKIIIVKEWIRTQNQPKIGSPHDDASAWVQNSEVEYLTFSV